MADVSTAAAAVVVSTAAADLAAASAVKVSGVLSRAESADIGDYRETKLAQIGGGDGDTTIITIGGGGVVVRR